MLLACLLLGSLASGHGGAVDAQGCHHDKAAGERHCHGSKGAGPAKAEETFEGKAVRVLDGDTLEVLREGRPVRLRLHGIDAPERYQDFAQASRKRLGELVMSKPVKVTVKDRDRYGRLVAELRLADGTSVNQELVRDGLAWWYRRYAPGDATLERLESEAKAEGKGLWSQPNPVQPALFRRAKGKKPVPVL